MRLKFFAIPALDPAEAEVELNKFLATHRILTIDRELTIERQRSFWALAVTYQEAGPAGGVKVGAKKPRIDYKDVLNSQDFAVYAELRSLRQAIAGEEAVPPYMIFTNAQLAEMVQERVRSLGEMGRIAGIGPARLKSHGAVFLERLREVQRTETPQGTGPGENDP